MCKGDTESVKVAPESVLSNRGNLEFTHLTRFSPVGGVLSPGVYIQGVISVHHYKHNSLNQSVVVHSAYMSKEVHFPFNHSLINIDCYLSLFLL